ncbi:MAG: hypothetical protein V4556_05955 [Bacteroidota bacterium]
MMKRLMVILALALMFSCNNSSTNETTVASKDTVTEQIDYAYLPENHPPDNWDKGDQRNIAMVLRSLKGFETKNIDQAMEPFADTVRWAADGIDVRMTKDSLRSMFIDSWQNMTNIKIKMDDYEAVISKDKKTEYVTLWYKQIVTNTKGEVDSLSCVDDVRIEKGKITEIDEKTRRYPAKI